MPAPINFTVNTVEGGSFLRQKLPVVKTDADVNILQPARVPHTKMSYNALIEVVKRNFTEAAPLGVRECVIYVLKGRRTNAASALIGPIKIPVEVLSSMEMKLPDGTQFSLRLMSAENMKKTFSAFYESAGKIVGITENTTLTVDEEETTVAEYLKA